MYLYVMSKDGGDREDCSIFYAQYLSCSRRCDTELQSIYGAEIKYGHICIPRDDDREESPLWKIDVVTELAALGVAAQFLTPGFVIEESW